MAEVKLLVSSSDPNSDPDAAAATLEQILREGHDGTVVSRSPLASEPEPVRKAIDPISVAALVLAIPSAVLAVMDLADRLGKRRKADRLIKEAAQLRIEQRIDVLIVTADGPKLLATLTADQVLEIAKSQS